VLGLVSDLGGDFAGDDFFEERHGDGLKCGNQEVRECRQHEWGSCFFQFP
jgi:hypothetical protein